MRTYRHTDRWHRKHHHATSRVVTHLPGERFYIPTHAHVRVSFSAESWTTSSRPPSELRITLVVAETSGGVITQLGAALRTLNERPVYTSTRVAPREVMSLSFDHIVRLYGDCSLPVDDFYRAACNADAVLWWAFCPSVCHTRGLWQNGRKICPDLYTIWKNI